jgi:SAM-dependent methyltransferase
MRWGAHPELVGPRHRYRVALMARTLGGYLPVGETEGGAQPASELAMPVGLGGRGPAPAPRSLGGGGPARVLDAGAGRGTLALLLARRGYAVTALEESAEFLGYLRARAGEADGGAGGRVALVRGDVAALPFDKASFDGVVCGEVLEHVADDGAAVAELARVLRPGGVLVATVPAGRARYGWLDRWAGHARRYELAELEGLVTACGFAVLRLHHWGFPFGLLYERAVQRPVLARHARDGNAAGIAVRVGGARLVTAAAGALFRLDHLCDAAPWGPGLLLVARRWA